MRKRVFGRARGWGLLVGVDVRLGLWRGVLARVINERGKARGEGKRTSCFFSSTLSETASLAAVARVDRPASVLPFAISGAGLAELRMERGGRKYENEAVGMLPLLPSLEAPDNAPWADSLTWLKVSLGGGISKREMEG